MSGIDYAKFKADLIAAFNAELTSTNQSQSIDRISEAISIAIGYQINVGSTTYTLPKATSSVLGGIRIGHGITIDPATGIASVSTNYQAPLGFIPEEEGIAAGLIQDLKDGVSTQGDTLKKLFDLIISRYSEVTKATIAERDAHNVQNLPTSIFVQDDGDGRWALYKAITTGTNATYIKISDPDLLNAVMSASQIASAYESVTDVNRFTNAYKTKVDTAYGWGNHASAGYQTKAQADLLYKPLSWNPDLSAYYTKTQNDAIYLGISSQAYDSARFGGQLPSYYQVAGSYLTSITKAQVEAVLIGQISSHTHNYQTPITLGSATQYLRGDLTLATLPSSLPASDVYAWAKASTKPANSWSEIISRPTALSQFTNDLGNYGGWITGINSSMVISALGSQTANMVFASPRGVSGNPSFRYLTVDDIPSGVNAYIWNQTGQQSAAINVSGNITTGGQFIGNGSALTGLTSSQIITALTYTPLPNRTFGTAANSNIGDFIQNNPSSIQSGSIWIDNGVIAKKIQVGKSEVSNSTYIGNLHISNSGLNGPNVEGGIELTSSVSQLGYGAKIYTNNSLDQFGIATRFNSGNWTEALKISLSNNAATFSSTVNATGFLLNGNNLTSNLTTNYLLKWNGSSFVNGSAVDDGLTYKILNTTASTLSTTGALVVVGGIGAASSTFGDNSTPPIRWGSTTTVYGMLDWFSAGYAAIYGTSGKGLYLGANGSLNMFNIYTNGNHSIGYAADQGYKFAVNGDGYFNGNVTASGYKTSRNSSYYVIATDGSDVLLSSIGNGLNSIQQTIYGSVNGSITCSQPFQGSTYKKVIIRVIALNGNATYPYPQAFIAAPIITAVSPNITLNVAGGAVQVSTSYAVSGWVVLEGY